MISRLPITLLQLKAGNNSEKLKNEIRQLLYSLYHLKNMTKHVYNNLIKYIWIKKKLRILNLITVHKIFVSFFYFHFHSLSHSHSRFHSHILIFIMIMIMIMIMIITIIVIIMIIITIYI